MRMMYIYKSNKHWSIKCHISQNPRNDRKIKTVRFLFLLSIFCNCQFSCSFLLFFFLSFGDLSPGYLRILYGRASLLQILTELCLPATFLSRNNSLIKISLARMLYLLKSYANAKFLRHTPGLLIYMTERNTNNHQTKMPLVRLI